MKKWEILPKELMQVITPLAQKNLRQIKNKDSFEEEFKDFFRSALDNLKL